MRGLAAVFMLVWASARHRPGRWLAAGAGLAVATAFACAVAGEATIAGDQAARAVLREASPAARTIRLTAQGPGSAGRARRAERLLSRLQAGPSSRVVLLNPVRLDGAVVRPAAISPLTRWASGAAAATLGDCVATVCPVLRTTTLRPAHLSAYRALLEVGGATTVSSGVPLGFAPGTGGGPPVVLGADPAGLDRIAGLRGVYRTESWLSVLPLSGLDSWQLAAVESRWQHVQATLPANGEFTLTAPFAVLAAARAQAHAAPRRLLLAGGGALAALVMFIVLAAYALRHERRADVRRLVTAGATTSQRVVFALAEAGLLAAVGLLLGAAVGVITTAGLAADAHVAAGAVLSRSLLTGTGAAALGGGWLMATLLMGFVLLARSARIADVLAVAAVAGLALALTRGAAADGALSTLLAPLTCAGAGVLVYRVAAAALRGAERLSRGGPTLLRLALTGLARAPAAPALAIAFVAISIGLGGFAVGYRSTLARGEADAAADRVPLDVRVTPGPSFTSPLGAAPMARWRALAGGSVLPVQRTDASFASGAAAVTVPALGIPAAGLPLIHGWRSSDGSAPLAILARRLAPAGPVRASGPPLGSGARSLAVRLSARGGAAVVTADLRSSDGDWRQLPLGTATARPGTVNVRIPAGRFALAALTLTAPTGLEITAGHQNGESLTAATQSADTVTIGPLRIIGGPAAPVAIGAWRATGAASVTRARAGAGAGAEPTTTLRVRFDPAGNPGVVRPAQPTDDRPVAVLADPATAAAADGGRLSLTVDGLPVAAVIAGTLRRFPTIPEGSSGFVIADQATLSAALDAALPGQGQANELWLDSPRPEALRSALTRAPLAGLRASFRGQVERALAGDPTARGVLGTLLGATVVAIVLAALGLLVSLLGPLRDRQAERELAVQGLGPRSLRRELGLRIMSVAGCGVLAGLLVAIVLTRLAVATVRAVMLAPGQPSLVTIAPWAQLGLVAGAGLLVFALTAGTAMRLSVSGRRR